MATGFGEWMVRMVMLVLAGLVTLSILGALAAMSNSAAVDVVEGPPPATAPIARTAERPTPSRTAPPDSLGPGAGPSPGQQANGTGSAGAAAPERSDRWLEAITYALLALAGLLALAILLLWRSLRQLRRLADAAEGRRN